MRVESSNEYWLETALIIQYFGIDLLLRVLTFTRFESRKTSLLSKDADSRFVICFVERRNLFTLSAHRADVAKWQTQRT